MATTYRCSDGDTLDRLCWQHYGSEAVVPQVLEANPGLAALGPQLPAGALITLPDLAPPPPRRIELWD